MGVPHRNDNIEGLAARARVLVYEGARALARLALRLKLTRPEVDEMLHTAFCHVLHERDWRVSDMTGPLGFKDRKLSSLMAHVRQLPSFVRYALDADVEYLLFKVDRPLLLSEIESYLQADSTPRRIRLSLKRLVNDGRVRRSRHRYVFSGRDSRVRDDISHQLRAWRRLLDNIVDAGLGRLHDRRPGPESFFRTLAYEIHPDQLPELRRFYDDVFFPFIQELERRAHTRQGKPIVLWTSLAWARPPEDDP